MFKFIKKNWTATTTLSIVFTIWGWVCGYVFCLMLNVSNPVQHAYSEYDSQLVKAYIMDYIELPSSELQRLDISCDGYVTSLDYVLIMDLVEAYNE